MVNAYLDFIKNYRKKNPNLSQKDAVKEIKSKELWKKHKEGKTEVKEEECKDPAKKKQEGLTGKEWCKKDCKLEPVKKNISGITGRCIKTESKPYLSVPKKADAKSRGKRSKSEAQSKADDKKKDETNWNDIKHITISLINDYFLSGKESVLNKDTFSKKEKQIPKDEIVKKINEILDSKIRPAVARDGGDIKFKSFKDGLVEVELKGSCSGCPSSIMTLKQGVQNLLCHYIPEVKRVEAS